MCLKKIFSILSIWCEWPVTRERNYTQEYFWLALCTEFYVYWLIYVRSLDNRNAKPRHLIALFVITSMWGTNVRFSSKTTTRSFRFFWKIGIFLYYIGFVFRVKNWWIDIFCTTRQSIKFILWCKFSSHQPTIGNGLLQI